MSRTAGVKERLENTREEEEKGRESRNIKKRGEVAHKVNVDWVFAGSLICMQAS